MYKVFHEDIPRVFENYYIANRNIHHYDTRQVDRKCQGYIYVKGEYQSTM